MAKMCKMIVISLIFCFVIPYSLTGCNENVAFTETEHYSVESSDGTEYTLVGPEFRVWSFGELNFLGHIQGEKKTFVHFDEIKTGMYSVNDGKDVLVRYFPDNEFSFVYVKSGLLKTEVSLDNCIRFWFLKGSLFRSGDVKIPLNGITECEQFLDEIRCQQTAKEAGLYDSVTQPDGSLNNCYEYGYVCGVLQEDLNIFMPLMVISFDDKAYAIRIDDIEYVLPQKWLDKLLTDSSFTTN